MLACDGSGNPASLEGSVDGVGLGLGAQASVKDRHLILDGMFPEAELSGNDLVGESPGHQL